jgi:hypothetical protein
VDYELDDNPARIQPDVVWEYLSTDAYWGRWRTRAEIDAQLASAWRVVGAYRSDTGEQIGFARAVSDGVGFAYLADVFVLSDHRGQAADDRGGAWQRLSLGAVHRRRARPLRAVRVRRTRRDRHGEAEPPGVTQRCRFSRTLMLITIGVPSKL